MTLRTIIVVTALTGLMVYIFLGPLMILAYGMTMASFDGNGTWWGDVISSIVMFINLCLLFPGFIVGAWIDVTAFGSMRPTLVLFWMLVTFLVLSGWRRFHKSGGI